MTTHDESNSSLPPQHENSNMKNQKVYGVLPLFGVINMTITSGTTIYRAFNNGDIQIIAFVCFVYFGTFLLDYWFCLYSMLSPSDRSSQKLKLKIGIWVLLSSIMFGFACQFSTFASFVASLTFFGVVISGNTILFYVYFIWEGNNNRTTCSIKSAGKNREALASWYNGGNAHEKECRPLTRGVDNV